jgi:uncharacterized membrane protein (DUF2068 family)
MEQACVGRMVALLSGTLYLPWEIFKVVREPNWLHLSVFLLNIAILLDILSIRIAAYRSLAREEAEAQGQNQH